MKKILLAVTIFVVNYFAFGANKKLEVAVRHYQIGVTQIVEHAALDATRAGFERALREKKLSFELDLQIAQGDMSTQQLITNKFVSQNYDMIFAISTPSAQAALNSTKSKKIPVIYSAITDPKAAGLVGTNVTGTSDAVPMKEILINIQKTLPSAKKVGIIYNTSEKNSEVTVELAKKLAKEIGMEIVPTGVTNINEIPSGMDVLLKKSDVILMTTDNLSSSAFDLIIQKANKANKPVIGAIEDQVQKGALFSLTLSYENLGYQAGLMAVKIFDGAKPSSIPSEISKKFEFIKNDNVAKKYNIDFSKIK
ncbi:MAG: ABC transporter substrate-binding protein [Fusobacteriaceae bacterium]